TSTVFASYSLDSNMALIFIITLCFSFYEELLAHGVLKPLLSSVEGEVMDGVSSIVNHFLKQSGAEVLFNHQVTHIYQNGASWKVCRKATRRRYYVSNNPCIRFIAIDDQKRNLECCPSMVVHISVPFGVKHLEEAKEQVEPIILVKLNKLLPGLPQPDSIKCQKWRYSQVTSSVADCPGQMTPLSQPLLVCGGDGFTHSNFDGCIESALKVFDVLKSSL
uniref:Renalase, FAD-dependent amine oxidase n=1 Tax=Oncorhynchus kisutch TaxID=8019 RepID=A0A8C7HCT4_ONCKI